MTDTELRDEFAGKIIQGLCANNAVFAANGMNGWALVNNSEIDLVRYAYSIANQMMNAMVESFGGGKSERPATDCLFIAKAILSNHVEHASANITYPYRLTQAATGRGE